MRRSWERGQTRVAGPLAALLALAALAAPAPAAASQSPRRSAGSGSASSRVRSPAPATRAQQPRGPARVSREQREIARVERYWTPARMRAARPLELGLDAAGATHLRLGPAGPSGLAGASFAAVPTPEAPPFSSNGRIFIKRGRLRGYCSGTAIDSPSRQLVLTAGHCVNSGGEGGRASVWSNYMEFVPAYSGGAAPFGAFVARRGSIYALEQWTEHGNPDFDLGAMRVHRNAAGVNVADAIGGGATIASGLSRHQEFQSFGYPGESKRLQSCSSPYAGDDALTYPLGGPPTLAIRCRWAPGASGGGWLIAGGTEIDGINTYLHLDDKSRTYGPYFSQETVGKLVRGL
ncbi:MAG TPA: hypothetical protein VHI77_10710 [Solirubrobacterales bacterium]|jgi:V8-like Glu-specific endopeptidase|nr:hypothetical protein [Solirubrobacterales bacterium]